MLVPNKENEVFCAYVAGFVDGEGCIYVSASRHPTCLAGMYYQLRVNIVQVVREPLDLIHTAFGGSVSRRKKQKDFHTQTWSWTAQGKTALIFLKAIAPYMIVKKNQAEIAMSWPLKTGDIGKAIPEEHIHKRVEIMNDLLLLRKLDKMIANDSLC